MLNVRQLLSVVLVMLLVSCSQEPPNKHVSLTRINEVFSQTREQSLVSLPVVKGHGDPTKALSWSQSVVTNKFQRIYQMDALVEAVLLESKKHGKKTTYSLTLKGWGLLAPWNPQVHFYIGQYQVSGIKSLTPLYYEVLHGEEIFMAEVVLKVVDIQDWIHEPSIKKNFPEMETLLEDKMRKYIIFKGPDDEDRWKKSSRNIRKQLRADPELIKQKIQIISLNKPSFFYEGKTGESLRKAEKAEPATDEEIIEIIKEKVSRWAEPETAEIISFKQRGSRLHFSLLRQTSEIPDTFSISRFSAL